MDISHGSASEDKLPARNAFFRELADEPRIRAQRRALVRSMPEFTPHLDEAA